MLDTILDEEGDIPTQGRMLNDIIKSSNIERSKWAKRILRSKTETR